MPGSQQQVVGAPDKDVLVPPYVYLSEGCDPRICDRLNAAAEAEYQKEKARRAARCANAALSEAAGKETSK